MATKKIDAEVLSARRCRAKNLNGKQCKRSAVEHNRCHIHLARDSGEPLPWQLRKPKQQNTPVQWAKSHRRLNGQVLLHSKQPYFVEPLLRSQTALERKGNRFAFLTGRQVGKTQAALTLALWYLDTRGGSVCYAVPTQANASKMHTTVFMPAIHSTRFTNLWEAQTSNREVKTWTGRHNAELITGHVLGGNMTSSGDQFRGISSGLILFDEFGTMPDTAVAVVESCADTFPSPVFWNFGSAGRKSDDLDKSFLAGTKAEWVIPCECGHYTILCPYGSDINDLQKCYTKKGSEYFYHCQHCHKTINPALGHWKHGQGDYPSYHIASMNSTFLTAEKLHKKLNSPYVTEETLMREVAGLPWGGEGILLDPKDIRLAQPTKDANHTLMGVDWGSLESHWVILKYNKEKAWLVDSGVVDGKYDAQVQKLFEIAKIYVPYQIACDHGWSGERIEKLNDLSGSAWAVQMNRSPTPGNVYIQIAKDSSARRYRVVKTYVVERLFEDLRSEKLYLAPKLEALKADLLAVSPEIKGKGKRDFVAYNTDHNHYASAAICAYSVYLRDAKRHMGASVGIGNPMSISVLDSLWEPDGQFA